MGGPVTGDPGRTRGPSATNRALHARNSAVGYPLPAFPSTRARAFSRCLANRSAGVGRYRVIVARPAEAWCRNRSMVSVPHAVEVALPADGGGAHGLHLVQRQVGALIPTGHDRSSRWWRVVQQFSADRLTKARRRARPSDSINGCFSNPRAGSRTLSRRARRPIEGFPLAVAESSSRAVAAGGWLTGRPVWRRAGSSCLTVAGAEVTLAQWRLSARGSRPGLACGRSAALSDVGRLQVVDSLEVGDISPRDLAAALGMSSNLLAQPSGSSWRPGWSGGFPRSPTVGAPTYAWFRGPGCAGPVPDPPLPAGRVVFVCSATPRARGPLRGRVGPPRTGRPVASAGTRPAARIHPGTRPGRPRPAAAAAGRPTRLDDRGPRGGGHGHHGLRLGRSRGPDRAHPLVGPRPGRVGTRPRSSGPWPT